MSSAHLPDTVLPILLAGGEGTRLRPITSDMPKPLIPVDGIPAICRILDTLAVLGADRAVITVRYRADDIIGLLGDDYRGIHLFYSREDEPRGTAGGVRDAWARYAEDSDTDALIISGDAVFTCDLAAFTAFHHHTNADASLLCVRVPDPGAFGTVISDRRGRITAFSEKPCAAETLSDTVNCGIYCMTRAFLQQIPADGTPDFGMDILPRALQAGDALYAFESPDYWCDIGSFAAYLACSLDISAGRIPKVSTPRTRTVLPPYIIDSSVGRECFVPASASVRGSILFDRVVIGTGASVTGSILCEGVRIGDGAVIEAGCVIGQNCRIGDRCRLPRGTRLEPNTTLQPQTAVRNAFDSGTVPEQYLSDLGYALSAGVRPSPETAVIFARALAAFAEKSKCALFLCHAEDTPALCCIETLVCEVLSCTPVLPETLCISRADGVLPLSAARMPQIPLPVRQRGCDIFRVVFLRRGGVPCAVLFDDAGLHPTRQTERLFDACLADANSDANTVAGNAPAHAAEPIPVRSIPAAELLAAYVARYAVGRLQHQNGTPFSFSCGGTPAERLLAALLCAMGGEERLQASVHFSVPLPSEDCGDILCPLTVSDLRTVPIAAYSHWTLLSLLAECRVHGECAVNAFPTPRGSVPTDVPIPLSLPVCAPEDTPADFRYAGTPSISAPAREPTPAALARNFAAAEAEDAVLLARDIAMLCSQTSRPLAALLQIGEKSRPSFRRHGFAHPRRAHTDGQPMCSSLSALTAETETDVFHPAVEGVVLRRDDGCVRIVATRDRNFRIIADAYTTEAAEELFRLARNRLLRPDPSKENA